MQKATVYRQGCTKNCKSNKHRRCFNALLLLASAKKLNSMCKSKVRIICDAFEMPKAALGDLAMLFWNARFVYAVTAYRVLGKATRFDEQSAKRCAKEHQQRSFAAAASTSSTAYLDVEGFRQQREQVLSHVLVHMQPAAVGGA